MYTGSLGGVSNAEDWIATFSLLNDDNTSFSVTGANITLRVCREGNSKSPVIKASTADGSIAIVPDGSSFSWTVPFTSMQNLCPGSYNAFVRMTLNGVASQLISGTVSIIEGGPTT